MGVMKANDFDLFHLASPYALHKLVVHKNIANSTGRYRKYVRSVEVDIEAGELGHIKVWPR